MEEEIQELLADLVIKTKNTIRPNGGPVYAHDKNKSYKLIQYNDGGVAIQIDERRSTGWQKITRYEYGSGITSGTSWYGSIQQWYARGVQPTKYFDPSQTQLQQLMRLISRLSWSVEKK